MLTFLLTFLLTIDGRLCWWNHDDKPTFNHPGFEDDHPDFEKEAFEDPVRYEINCDGILQAENPHPENPIDEKPDPEDRYRKPDIENPNRENLDAVHPDDGIPHPYCLEILTGTVRQRIEHKKSVDYDILQCLEKFCCTRRGSIDEELKRKKAISKLMEEKERECKKWGIGLTGMDASFFG